MFRKCSILVGLLVVSLTLTAFSNPFQAAGQNNGIPWWGWALIILVLLALGWWLRRRPSEEEAAPVAKIEAEAPPPVTKVEAPPLIVEAEAPPPVAEVEAPPPVVEAPAPVEELAPPTPDDLKRIEGIGPKISSVLQEAGITTFAQLAATDVGQLEQILRAANVRLANPGTWPEQAKLAAAGQWDALETMQSGLKGGKRA